MPSGGRIVRTLLIGWAGLAHVWTLLTLVAFFYFPVYLDSHASRTPRVDLPWLGMTLAAGLGPLVRLVERILDREGARIPRLLRAPARSAMTNLALWLAFSLWMPTGRVLWDAGPAWAGVIYFLYWVAAGLSGYALSVGDTGLGYFTGCAPILEFARGATPSPPGLRTRSLYRWSRHPALVFLLASLWLTPVMTLDRLVWLAIVTLHAVCYAGRAERAREARFGEAYRLYRLRVPMWLPLRSRSGSAAE
jgi:protein-S-isoprenylcysteine O-methyltransferase Ste14